MSCLSANKYSYIALNQFQRPIWVYELGLDKMIFLIVTSFEKDFNGWMGVRPLSSPEVDLIFLAKDPLVFACQVGHAEKFLQRGWQKKVTVYSFKLHKTEEQRQTEIYIFVVRSGN